MKRITTTIVILLITLSASSQTEIKLEDINKHIGDSVKICAKVYGGIYLERSKGTPTFLNVGGNYPNSPLTIVIWEDVRKSFTEKPEEFYKEKNVCVTGKLELYNNKPQIVLKNKDLISAQE